MAQPKKHDWRGIFWITTSLAVLGFGILMLNLNVHPTPECDGKAMSPGDICRITTRGGFGPNGTTEKTYDEMKASEANPKNDASFVIGIGGLMLVGSTVGAVRRRSRTPGFSGSIKALKGAERVDAVTALGKIGDPRAVEPLIAVLQDTSDPNWVVRARAATALGEIGDARAVEPLIAALKYGHESYCAATALGKIGDRRAIEPLVDALGGRDATLRDGRLSESEANRRQHAAEALAGFGDARAVDPLIDALGGRYAVNRSSAATALGKIGLPAVEPLIAALTAEPRAAPGTVEALRKLGATRASDVVNDQQVHQIVAKAAGELAHAITAERGHS